MPQSVHSSEQIFPKFVQSSENLHQKQSVISARETFVVNQLSVGHEVEYGKKNGDFVIDRRYTFEVGGPDKTFKQIANVPDSYILADNLEYASGNKLPLWMVGLKLCKNPSRISMFFYVPLYKFVSVFSHSPGMTDTNILPKRLYTITSFRLSYSANKPNSAPLA